MTTTVSPAAEGVRSAASPGPAPFTTMLSPDPANIRRPAPGAPRLMVLIDTEEEFDWGKPMARANTATASIKAQFRAHKLFERYGITPIYTIDYPVATRPDGYGPLLELYQDGKCDIGAHLHPWVNPPFDEAVDNRNSYPGNLPPALEKAKLAALTQAIEDRFGFHPVVYKAGRYGVGAATTGILSELGYEIDASVVPLSDFSDEEGPDFSACPQEPYRFGKNGSLLELPLSVGYVGAFAGAAPGLYKKIRSPGGMSLRLPGIFSRLGLLERIRLSPEGVSHTEHRRLADAMLAAGHRVFNFTYHSPSLEPGHTPYVRDDAELGRFLDKFERFFDYFFGERGGRPATPFEIRSLLPE